MVVLRGKCILVGDSTVGKTAIAQSFRSDGSVFPKNYLMSTNVDVITKFIPLSDGNKETVDMFLFDTSGKAVFKDLTEIHLEKLGMIAVIFDVTNSDSFTNCEKWLRSLKQFCEPDKTIPGVLIGNKVDLDQRRKISSEAAKAFASSNGLTYFECSAKEYEGIEAPFRWLAEHFHKLYQESTDSIQQIE